jgi:hypothetical protein
MTVAGWVYLPLKTVAFSRRTTILDLDNPRREAHDDRHAQTAKTNETARRRQAACGFARRDPV